MALIHQQLGLRPIINVSGTMTGLGASIIVPQAAAAIAAVLPEFVEISDLQRKASAVIAQACGAQAGCVTASSAAGITLTVAAAMTGDRLGAIEALPCTQGLKSEVLIQIGHVVSYGAPVDQAIRLAGATVRMVGQATYAQIYQLEAAFTAQTAAAVYVVSHHTVKTGLLALPEFVETCHAHGVPVIVDAASEYDLRSFIAAGADVVIYSAQKFLGGPTAGIVAGRKDLIRHTYLQNLGIGRGMKVGKEGIVGSMAALHAWETRGHAKILSDELAHLQLWQAALNQHPGVHAVIVPDPTHNPLSRLQVNIDPSQANTTAWDLADALANGSPPVIVRDHEVEHGYFLLDPCNLQPGQAQLVSQQFAQALTQAHANPKITPLSERRQKRLAAMLRWPD